MDDEPVRVLSDQVVTRVGAQPVVVDAEVLLAIEKRRPWIRWSRPGRGIARVVPVTSQTGKPL